MANYAVAKDIVSWEKVVPDSKSIGVFTHTYYPVIFKDGVKRTHFGVDICGNECSQDDRSLCGKPIYPLYPGYVINTMLHPNEHGLGNAVLMRHPGRAEDGGDLYTVYFHMQDAPLVTSGWINGLSPIGYVGDTGFANDICHVHFEIRNFLHEECTDAWYHKKLGCKIYATGDYSNKSWVLSDWEDPADFYVKTGYRIISDFGLMKRVSVAWWPSDVPCDKASLWSYSGFRLHGYQKKLNLT
jgi:murein DD-endopeptidase MepM/ murein hydrolase activator NlpD